MGVVYKTRKVVSGITLRATEPKDRLYVGLQE